MTINESFAYEAVTGFKFGSQWIGKPKMISFVYYVDGLLIDTGHRKMQKQILQTLSPLTVDQLFITHHHEDHSGNIAEVQAMHKCPVYASTECSQLMKSPPSISLAQKLTWGSRPPYEDLIAKEDVLQTPNYAFQIIPIPGHASDMVALYEPDRKWLFSADLFINTHIGYFLYTESILQQIESINRILKLDFKVMLCSHNPQFENPKQQLIKKRDFLNEFYDKVAKLHKEGYQVNEIMNILKLQEYKLVKLLSGGHLSKKNMVTSVIRDFNT
ncbi:MBL fold metallo-hydrolase [Aquimarina brevivitae]|uniref:Glyoxylase-like metal-dependent hydrolase (Beta-lactamase superfamily II) n=1 Tax=Aquimarina brevivitae TaxID=323412 RepID=A0A4Q7NYE7_9FLAO|nr:MBL fold metallo-hydrolase [Aquimarina brevivitae]RZS92466.1 glyoxylase-like metal-dependent hydrolase (beta-lactamase superfamily II) [Aquimarina brevivitae]